MITMAYEKRLPAILNVLALVEGVLRLGITDTVGAFFIRVRGLSFGSIGMAAFIALEIKNETGVGDLVYLL